MSRELTLKDKLFNMLATLRNERSSFKSHWRDLADYILPRRQRFFLSDVNRGERKNLKIYDTTATFSARTLKSGMMAGITSPARPWFRLSTPDPDLADTQAVKEWLHEVTSRMRTIFLKSNLYQTLPTIYGDIGVFGTGCMMIREDSESVIRFEDYPIGSYMIANDEKGRIRVWCREYRMTVRQVVEEYGRQENGEIDWTNISQFVQDAWMNGRQESWVDLLHFVYPNDEYEPDMLDARFKKYRSVHYEYGSDAKGPRTDKTLRDSGFDYFPLMVPRWDVTGEDVYGTASPGMDTLGDVKQLQTGQKRLAQAIDKMVNPPMKGPPGLRAHNPSLVAGDITYFTDDKENGLRPIHEVDPRILDLKELQEETRGRIRRGFYEDLFLMLATSDRRQITAREIEERHEEKLLALGPTLEQLNQSLLDPLIDTTYAIMEAQGLIPEPPEELEGIELKVEYVSIMAQAQKLVGISGLERFTGFVTNLSGAIQDPSLLDKVNFDEVISEHHDAVGLTPKIIRSDEEANQIRDNRARAQQAQAQAEQIKNATGAVKDLAGAKLEDDSALNRLLGVANAGNPIE